jgi:hypothetical protein
MFFGIFYSEYLRSAYKIKWTPCSCYISIQAGEVEALYRRCLSNWQQQYVKSMGTLPHSWRVVKDSFNSSCYLSPLLACTQRTLRMKYSIGPKAL